MIVYIDDILIYSQNDTEHRQTLRQVLELLDNTSSMARLQCEFFKESVEYLGHIISSQGIATDPRRLTPSKPGPTDQPQGTSVLLGIMQYYRCYALTTPKLPPLSPT